MKTCTTCKCDKQLSEFGRHKLCKDGISPVCKECRKLANKKYHAEHGKSRRSENPLKFAEIEKRWRVNNANKVVAMAVKYYADHKEKISEIHAKYRLNNKDKIAKRHAEYYLENKEKCKDANKKWSLNNPGAKAAYSENRRAKKKYVGGVLSKSLPQNLYKLQRGKCACCGKPLGDSFQLDHIMPLALGGLNVDNNIQLLRATCNQQKRAKHPIDFMRSRGFLL